MGNKEAKSAETHLVLICGPHVLDNLLGLLFRDAAVLGQDPSKNSVTADIEVCLLLQEIVDLLAALLETVLDVDLLSAFSRECRDKLKLVSEDLLVFLGKLSAFGLCIRIVALYSHPTPSRK
jgi:hypothetical protein